jgi:hypothetical protein
MSNSEYGKSARAKHLAKDKCIWGCGEPSATPCGLCESCAEKNRKRRRARYKKNKK